MGCWDRRVAHRPSSSQMASIGHSAAVVVADTREVIVVVAGLAICHLLVFLVAVVGPVDCPDRDRVRPALLCLCRPLSVRVDHESQYLLLDPVLPSSPVPMPHGPIRSNLHLSMIETHPSRLLSVSPNVLVTSHIVTMVDVRFDS